MITVRQHDNGATGAQLQVSDDHFGPDATGYQMIFAPVELEGFAQVEFERNVGFDQRLAPVFPPAPDELTDPNGTAVKASGLQFDPPAALSKHGFL